MLNRRQQLCCYISLLLFTSVLCADIKTTSPTTRAPSKRYPVRTFLGNMYHRFRNNKTPSMILIPPLLRLAYQYGGPLLERMGSALGLGAPVQAAASAPIENLVESAIGGALAGGAQAAGGAGGAPMAMPFGGFPPGLGGFGAAPMGGFGRPVYFRRRRR